ncbi:hypothetical protein [Mucilaginibacter sp.]|uniref:hypothetical protein n=1 Tax=Mucilaginibacter sp. TaxID=1882438 RepID=UPI002615DC19|nr:hypothetical protein [Mucilaginibacter sp.]MDB4920518.1 hypothetical protein [Mucilaginibacter sp.]
MALEKNRLDSEMFGDEGRHYFIDLLKAKNNKPYLQISRSDTTGKNQYDRSSVILFEDDFEFFVAKQ